MKRNFARGLQLAFGALPHAFDVAPTGVKREVVVQPFKSKATLAGAWNKTGGQLRSTVNTFSIVHDRREKARAR